MTDWYALRVRSNFEKVVQQELRQLDVEDFLPVYLKKSRWSDRVKTLEMPLFPGYVFGRFDPRYRLPILKLPGVVHILGNSSGPIPVDDAELQDIRRSVESGLPVTPWPFLTTGDSVVVEDGALSGLQGILLRVKDSCRIVVSLMLLQRSVAVELDRASIRPVRGSSSGSGPSN